jgi:uncharacterized membrane protein YccC
LKETVPTSAFPMKTLQNLVNILRTTKQLLSGLTQKEAVAVAARLDY